MSRWAPIPVAVGASLTMANLSPSARCVWLALRLAHAGHGQGGVLPAAIASARGLALAVPALVADIDVPDALAELGRAGLVRQHDDGVALADWDVEAEQAPCSSCRRRNPDPRHRRCPSCRAKDTDPTRRASRKRGTDAAQTSRDSANGRAGPQLRGLAVATETTAQSDRKETADMPRPQPYPTLPNPTDPTDPTDPRARARADQAEGSRFASLQRVDQRRRGGTASTGELLAALMPGLPAAKTTRPEQAASSAKAAEGLCRLASDPMAVPRLLSMPAQRAVLQVLDAAQVLDKARRRRHELATQVARKLDAERVLMLAFDVLLGNPRSAAATLRDRLKRALAGEQELLTHSRATWPIGRFLDEVRATA